MFKPLESKQKESGRSQWDAATFPIKYEIHFDVIEQYFIIFRHENQYANRYSTAYTINLMMGEGPASKSSLIINNNQDNEKRQTNNITMKNYSLIIIVQQKN